MVMGPLLFNKNFGGKYARIICRSREYSDMISNNYRNKIFLVQLLQMTDGSDVFVLGVESYLQPVLGLLVSPDCCAPGPLVPDLQLPVDSAGHALAGLLHPGHLVLRPHLETLLVLYRQLVGDCPGVVLLTDLYLKTRVSHHLPSHLREVQRGEIFLQVVTLHVFIVTNKSLRHVECPPAVYWTRDSSTGLPTSGHFIFNVGN